MANFSVKLHEAQERVFWDSTRFRTLVCGRRFGKSYLALMEVITRTLEFKGARSKTSPEVTLVSMPTLQQARGILWEPLVRLFEETDLKRLKPDINRSNFTITLKDKPIITMAGANDRDGDGMRGKRIWFLLCDEFQDFKPSIFTTICRPAMADTPGSRGLFTGTPKGKLHHFYQHFNLATEHPEQFRSFNLPTTANPFVPREEIEEARRTMPPRLFRQEFEASWESFPGRIFYELDASNQATLLNYQGMGITVLGVDWGDVHPAFSVLGRRDGCWYFLEGWRPTDGTPVPGDIQDQNLIRLARTYNVKATLCDPSRPSSILHVRDLGKEHGLPGLTKAIAGYNRIEEGLEQVHSLIYQKRFQFYTGQVPYLLLPGTVTPAEAYELFASYRRKTDKQGQVTDQVEDGQDDHIVDSCRYAIASPKGKR